MKLMHKLCLSAVAAVVLLSSPALALDKVSFRMNWYYGGAHAPFQLGLQRGFYKDEGIDLTKFWFSVTQGEQRTRFAIREIDPVRQWKLSPTDIALLAKWDDYTQAKGTIFSRTHSPHAPWTVVKSNDKKRARLEAMRSLLAKFDYDDKDDAIVGTPDPLIVGAPVHLRELDPA